MQGFRQRAAAAPERLCDEQSVIPALKECNLLITQSGRFAPIWVVPQEIPVPYYMGQFYFCNFFKEIFLWNGQDLTN